MKPLNHTGLLLRLHHHLPIHHRHHPHHYQSNSVHNRRPLPLRKSLALLRHHHNQGIEVLCRRRHRLLLQWHWHHHARPN